MAEQPKDDEIEDEKDVKAAPEGAAKEKPAEEEGEEVTLEADTEDSRLDVEAGAETVTDRQARRRDEKRQRRDRQRHARAAKDAEIESLRAQLSEYAGKLNGIAVHLSKQDAAALDYRAAAAKSRAKEATEIFVKANKVGDEDAMAQALEIRDNARDEARALDNYKQNVRLAAERSAPRQSAPDPVVLRRVKEFTEDHPWYNTNGRDQESKLILALDAQVAAEGFDPRSDEYWDELEDRAAQVLPKRFSQAEQRPAAQRRGPQLGSGRTSESQGGKKTVFVSRARKEAMVEAGLWDDPVKRNKVLKDYERLDREGVRT